MTSGSVIIAIMCRRLWHRGPGKLLNETDWIQAGRRVFEQLDTIATRTDDPEALAHFTDAKSIDAYPDSAHDVMDAQGALLAFLRTL